ncbi:EAL and HDOD domain-containing protein [Roseateles amylovorans]|uniref:HDOD domain-containing protein n=1 Tax=Roseateles amylovorans TaxID=2978473 RepID=A0ABY6B9D2_9BURK|nr:HDOD domain-containing protein [Roseateles amylovorans]UXH79837.1 HDOD domain-containing protein [Roseateles amylovorans]
MNSTHAVLGQLALGYAPLVSKQLDIEATRVTVFALRPEVSPAAAELVAALSEAFPDKPVLLNIAHEGLLKGLLATALPKNMRLEIPAFLLSDADLAAQVQARAAEGATSILKGRSDAAGFKQIILDLSDLASGPAPAGKSVLVSGARSADDFKQAWDKGAAGVLGWPMHGEFEAPATPPTGKDTQAADLQVIVELMSRVDQGEDVERLEQTLKRDPSLAFKLLRYMNSAAFGLSVEVSSFRHAIMLLGYARLRRWLALLLATASKDHAMRPVMFAALRRGLLMEELAKGMAEAELRDEMFICGLFSLLDHMLRQPFSKLLQSIPVPERVRQALVDKTGPYHGYLELVQAIENESVFDVRTTVDNLMLGTGEVNSAVLRALHKAAQLE